MIRRWLRKWLGISELDAHVERELESLREDLDAKADESWVRDEVTTLDSRIDELDREVSA